MSLSHVFMSDMSYFQMFKLICYAFALTCFVRGEPTNNDKSFLKYANPKYVKEAEVTMFQRKRNEPYKTNVTVTSLHNWSSNVSIQISYSIEGGNKAFKINTKVCELLDKVWAVEVMRTHSNITECPLTAGTYVFYNVAVVPKVLPQPAPTSPKGSTSSINVLYYLTATKEKILELQLRVLVRAN